MYYKFSLKLWDSDVEENVVITRDNLTKIFLKRPIIQPDSENGTDYVMIGTYSISYTEDDEREDGNDEGLFDEDD